MKCEECDGAGYIQNEFVSETGAIIKEKVDCEECDGTGITIPEMPKRILNRMRYQIDFITESLNDLEMPFATAGNLAHNIKQIEENTFKLEKEIEKLTE